MLNLKPGSAARLPQIAKILKVWEACHPWKLCKSTGVELKVAIWWSFSILAANIDHNE